ncbi:MAG: sel1 repeat family protein [Rhodospirillaceae bacterium]|nr:sel1 repeat family protein [Rhodospirillaceae bacterium]
MKVKFLILAALAAVFLPFSAIADTEAGVEAFRSKNFDVALKELRPAAKAGDAAALYTLAQMYGFGYGVKKDLAKALEFYGKAANLGHVPAQKEYGTALAIGDGTEQNVSEGLKWLFIAGRAGNEEAQQYALRFSKYMNRLVVITARRKAVEWQSAYNRKIADAEATTNVTAPKN